ncbi:uncharacterized protein TNIN_160231 [Trichonephila inaurata madagascariensis]|uniref:Uncharacterized protein n=1 Tax=Trichonephila inaurata madagascariensis TaxID=2747483 RepID=A0A8X6I4B4_9ARAC|nr:uncharacterized protein TNIN_160231 [Trichonephila inaurata madagascariensis]
MKQRRLKKKKEKYRRKISKVSTLEFKDNVLRKAEHSDPIGDLVKILLFCEYDLIASAEKYHALCNTNFLNRLPSNEKKHRQDNQVSELIAGIFNYIENHNDSQFTLKELRDVLTGYVPDDKTIITRLQQKYLTDIIITTKVKDDADVLFVETAIEESEHHKTAIIVEDIDLLVIVIGRTQSHQEEVFYKKVGKGNVKTQIYSSKSFDKYPHGKKHILFPHAYSGCDTTSEFFKKGKKKKTFIRIIRESSEFGSTSSSTPRRKLPWTNIE